MKSVIIKSNKIILRPLSKDDIKYYQEYANNKKMYSYGFTYPFSIKLAKKYINKILKSKKEKSFAIEIEGHFIGEFFSPLKMNLKQKLVFGLEKNIGEKV